MWPCNSPWRSRRDVGAAMIRYPFNPAYSVWACRGSNTLLILLFCGCAFTHTVSGPGPSTIPLRVLSSLHNGLSLAVWLENHCEKQESDTHSLTLLEALHDGLIVPAETVFTIGVVAIVSTILSLYDRVFLLASLSPIGLTWSWHTSVRIRPVPKC